jgi:hypothetical protein
MRAHHGRCSWPRLGHAMPIDALHPRERETNRLVPSTVSHQLQQAFPLFRYKGPATSSCWSESCTSNFKDCIHRYSLWSEYRSVVQLICLIHSIAHPQEILRDVAPFRISIKFRYHFRKPVIKINTAAFWDVMLQRVAGTYLPKVHGVTNLQIVIITRSIENLRPQKFTIVFRCVRKTGKRDC